MATYVGSLRADKRLGRSCCMVAGSIGELQGMAIRLGLQLRWMKQGPARFVLTEGQRQRALWAGAIPCSHADAVRFAQSGVRPEVLGYWIEPVEHGGVIYGRGAAVAETIET